MTGQTNAAEALLHQAREQRGHDDRRAVLLFEQAVSAARREAAPALLADALNGLAGLEHAQGDSQSALVHLDEALRLREQLQDPEGVGVVLCNIGAVHLELGSHNTALEYLLQADAVAEKGTPARVASIATNLARTHDALGAHEEAGAQYRRALALIRQAGHPFGEAVIAVNHADLLRRQRAFAASGELLQQALTLGAGAVAACAWHGLGQLRRDEGRLTEALDAFTEALQQAGSDLDARLDACCGAGEVLLDLGLPEDALRLLDEACRSARQGQRARIHARALSLRARGVAQRGDPAATLEALQEAHQAETQVLRAEGERRTRDLVARGVLDQARVRLEREQARYELERATREQHAREQAARLAELERLALYDALTGLPNRLLLAERTRTALEAATRRGGQLALGALDLNKFKAVNDTHGHHVGDLLLQGVAARLSAVLGPQQTVARTGGDEFVLLTEDADDHQLRELAGQIRQAFSEPFFLDGVELNMRPSLGFARYPEDGTSMAALLERADHAMYRAKARGSDYERCTHPTALAPATLESALHGAVRGGELHLLYQPLEDRHGRWHSAEALLRWRSPVYGNVTPDQFLPLAERSGLSLPLGEWTLTQACAQLATLPGLRLAVNVSARQLADPGLPALVQRAVQQAGLEPARLSLEVREDVVARAPERSRQALTALRETGVRLTLDDFGGSHTHLEGLQRLPVHAVKLDRTLVQGLDRGTRGGALVAAVVHLARALDLEVMAKGVETQAQQAQLREIGVHNLQGFLISAPLDLPALQARLGVAEAAH
ncbi:EAL domain-containing protein [Deinococcus sonorensis]|uniref:EAL domain-containing protein n=2 Tax=Deinococcus sonorensis TaxID=309891 RepID=A0AAU7UG85_9DEIO